jgi:hypothetical protein
VTFARIVNALAGGALIAALATGIGQVPHQMPDRMHRVDRVTSLVAWSGLAGAGPGTSGRL